MPWQRTGDMCSGRHRSRPARRVTAPKSSSEPGPRMVRRHVGAQSRRGGWGDPRSMSTGNPHRRGTSRMGDSRLRGGIWTQPNGKLEGNGRSRRLPRLSPRRAGTARARPSANADDQPVRSHARTAPAALDAGRASHEVGQSRFRFHRPSAARRLSGPDAAVERWRQAATLQTLCFSRTTRTPASSRLGRESRRVKSARLVPAGAPGRARSQPLVPLGALPRRRSPPAK